MKLNLRRLTVIILAALIFGASLWSEEKVLVATGEWSPYTSEKVKGGGFFTEIVGAVFKEMGVKAEYQFLPWVRAENLVASGLAFACMPYSSTPERLKSFQFSDPVTVSAGVFFYFEGGKVPTGFDWKVYSDLRPYLIGGVSGYWYESAFREAGLSVEYAADEKANLGKLSLKRVDLVPLNQRVGWELIREYFPSEAGKFGTLPKTIEESPLRLMVSRTYPDAASLLVRFNAALAKIKKNGIYEAILKAHNFDDDSTQKTIGSAQK